MRTLALTALGINLTSMFFVVFGLKITVLVVAALAISVTMYASIFGNEIIF